MARRGQPPLEKAGRAVASMPASLLGAFGPHSTLTLERFQPDGETHWRVTAAVVLPTTGREGVVAGPAAAEPAVASGGSVLMSSTVTLVALWPDAYFTVAAMLLTGARLEVREGDLAAASEILGLAVASAPQEMPLPDGRRLRPRPQDLERVRRLLPDSDPAVKPATLG